MDTGNGAHACSMHAEDIKISGKTVSWTYDGKRYSALKYRESPECLEAMQKEKNHLKLELPFY